MCGSASLTQCNVEFDTVIVDEASQGIELSTLIALKMGCTRLILVGDPKQLPATVFSNVAIKYVIKRYLPPCCVKRFFF
jgi:senataxin